MSSLNSQSDEYCFIKIYIHNTEDNSNAQFGKID